MDDKVLNQWASGIANWALQMFFRRRDFTVTGGTAAHKSRPIVLDADGHIDASLINDADVDHGSLGGLTDVADHPDYLLKDGTRPLTANWDAGSFEIRAETLESDVATGTAPLTVASTTKVTNLNADLLDGLEAAAFATDADFDAHTAATAAHGATGAVVGTTNAQTLSSKTLNTLVLADGGELTIAAGVVTATHSRHAIDTEADAATDDLDTINGGVDGMVLFLRPESGSRDVVVKHATGNIGMKNGSDFTLNESGDRLMLMYNSSSSSWIQLAERSVT